MKIKTVLTFPLHILLCCCSLLFRWLVQFHAALLASILQQDCVQSAMSAILVRGMNDFLIQPDLNEKIQIMADTMSKNQEKAAHKAGQEFPKLVGNFIHGMMNAKKQQQQQQQQPSNNIILVNAPVQKNHSHQEKADKSGASTTSITVSSSSSSSSTVSLASSSSESSIFEETTSNEFKSQQSLSSSLSKDAAQQDSTTDASCPPTNDHDDASSSFSKNSSASAQSQSISQRPHPFHFWGGWNNKQPTRAPFFKRSSSLPRTPTTSNSKTKPHQHQQQ